jgi:O-antigen/teichoic acid export membrane protein
MAFRVLGRLRRHSVTAAGVYAATVFGFLTSVAATRVLGVHDYARFATVVAVVGFFQMLMDLTIEEALVKYGFRYSAAEDWGRFRRLFELAVRFKLAGGVLALVAIAALAPVARAVWDEGGLAVPMLVGAFVPLAQSLEGVAGGALILRGRYDLRAAFYSVSMALRLLGVGVGSMAGVSGALAGMLAAQVLATAAIAVGGLAAFRRFPAAPSASLAGDRGAFRTFVVQSTVGSSLVSARSTLGTMLIGWVAPLVQAAYFRNGQAPLTGLGALSSPARLVLLTVQTADYERGRRDRVLRLLRRYIVGTTLAMLVAVPLLWWAMPWLMELAYGEEFRRHATGVARIVLLVGALQLVYGWTKTLPVSIGRPGLRILAHGLEVATFLPLLLLFGSKWGAEGAAWAMLASTGAFCALWTVLLLGLRDDIRTADLRAEPA